MSEIKVIASTNENTVVSEYVSDETINRAYQSEENLEKDFIRILCTQSYEYLQINSEQDLINNLRKKLEELNDYIFSDSEWKQLFENEIANPNYGIVEKTKNIQVDHIKNLILDNGLTKNIKLIDKKSIHNNKLQVINQYETTGNYNNRYDVTILVNGFPLVHVELKRRGISIREAFNQIERYQRDSFWAGCGLYEYVQIFVISNGTHTKYYSNTTRNAHIKELKTKSTSNSKKTSNSFEFTSYWADANNKAILDLVDFTKTFFSKHALLNVITKYCVFTSEKLLLVMRPYQIVATEKIINRIEIANNYKMMGNVKAGGYVWHTTGSGKTLTSFKTAQLASNLSFIDKVLFIVDRKDLDYQTMKEYDRFEKGCANGNTSTAILKRQLENPDCKIIITTIQKLGSLIGSNKNHDIYSAHVVLIFDECHRSQFGEFHNKITGAFNNYHIFGFTGTPIFKENATKIKNAHLTTTEQAFGDKLHTYTIVDAIKDENVLPFRIDYINTIKEKDDIKDKKIPAIDQEKVLIKPARITQITKYILEHFDLKTKRNKSFYNFFGTANIKAVATSKNNKIEAIKNKVRLSGFNSIFAVSSIQFAKAYYYEFKKQMEELPEAQRLRVATIFSYGVNESEDDITMCDENSDDASLLDAPSRDFLESAIKDYNEMFKTNYDTSSDKFGNYYKDVSLRMKNREIDLLIVVNMFLTGFDATTLNTLWVDKKLKYHGLIQAFSRTNRILNSVKTYGNIVCFRDLQESTDEAIGLFGDKDVGGIVLLKDYESYYRGFNDNSGKHYFGYEEIVNKLLELFPIGTLIIGEKSEKDFINTFGLLLKIINILNSFDQFENEHLLSDYQMQNYQSIYVDLYEKYKKKGKEDKVDVSDDLEFEMELVKSVEVNIDYILMLIEKYHEGNCKDAEIVAKVKRIVDGTPDLRSKKELIAAFLATINADSNVAGDWQKYIEKKRIEDLQTIINEENLKQEETFKFMDNSFRDEFIKTTGTDIDKILPPVSLFGGKAQKKERVIEKLEVYFDKYNGLF